MPERLNPEEARQGKKGRPVLIVLIAALILAALAWGAAELFGDASDPVEPVNEQVAPADAGNEPATEDVAPAQ